MNETRCKPRLLQTLKIYIMNTENNKIIAEFMGLCPRLVKPDYYVLTHNQSLFVSGDTPEKVIEEFSKCAMYNTDWNWLMEVVEKIESLEFQPKNSTCIGFDTFGVEINKERCDITRYGDFTSNLLQGNGKTRIESVYNACLEFVKWYNLKNQ